MHRLWRVRAGVSGYRYLSGGQRSGTMAELHRDELRALRHSEEVRVTTKRHKEHKTDDKFCAFLCLFWLLSPSDGVPQMADTHIVSSLQERRVFPPDPEFSKRAHISSLDVYDSLAKGASEDPESFWAQIASDLHWFAPWNK